MTEYDLAVIGGGPAGLSAAAQLAELGGRVIVFDENASLGGKLRGQIHEEPDGSWWNGPDEVQHLLDRCVQAGVVFETLTTVWGIAGLKIRASQYDLAQNLTRDISVRARTVLLATGAAEKPMPLPGWTLPGVMTIGAAQNLTNIQRVKPGGKVLIAGVDVLSLSIARSMKGLGVDVVGIVQKGEITGGGPKLDETMKSFSKVAKFAPNIYMRIGATLLRWSVVRRVAGVIFPATVRIWGMRIKPLSALLEIHGEHEVAAVSIGHFSRFGTLKRVERVSVDAVCLSNGLRPLNELSIGVVTRFFRSQALGGTVPIFDSYQRSEVPGLYFAGNAIGVESSKVALRQGALVARVIALDLGLENITAEELDAAVDQLQEYRRRQDFVFSEGVPEAAANISAQYGQGD